MKISLIMILKNEASTIKKAIHSVAELIDEYVIAVDDSTTDNTREILIDILPKLKYEFIYEFKFEDDFAAARNKFIEKAKNEWVMILDGHEYLEKNSLEYIHHFKETEKLQKDLDIIDFNIIDIPINKMFQQPRLFRKKIKYDLAVHNVIGQMNRRKSAPQLIIYHDQPLENLKKRREQRSQMNIKKLKELADTGDARSMYYLAESFHELNDLQNAEKWYKKYINVSIFDHERYDARIKLASIYHKLSKYDLIEPILLDCFQDDVAENQHLIMLGDYYYVIKNYTKAIQYFRMSTVIKKPEVFIMINPDNYTWIPWHKLAICYMEINDVDGVRECIDKGRIFNEDLFSEMENKLHEQVAIHVKRKKGSIYVVSSINSFIMPIIKNLNEDYYLRHDQQFSPDNAQFADLIFCEWADMNAIAVSKYKTKAKKILRIHAYEIFTPFMTKIDFNAFDDIIFVADHIRDFFIKHVTNLNARTRVIPNGVNLEKFSIKSASKNNNKIAYAGFITNKKGANLLLFLAKTFKKYEFHLAGSFQEPDVADLFQKHHPENMFLCGWQDDLNKFFEDKKFIINTSPREGCPISMLEGMAAGLKPLVYRWVGSQNIFPGFTYENREDLSVLLNGNLYEPKTYRKIVEENFNQKEQLKRITEVITTNIIKENVS